MLELTSAESAKCQTVLQQSYFVVWQKRSLWDKTCRKNTIGTFLRHLKQTLWY